MLFPQKSQLALTFLLLLLGAAQGHGPTSGYETRHALYNWTDIPGLSACVAVADSNTPETAAGYDAVATRMAVCTAPSGLCVSRPTHSAQEAGALRVLILGGSATAGVDCHDGQHILKACAWGGRLTRWLEAEYPGVRTTVLNQASGGTTIMAALPSLWHFLQFEPDIIFADFTVNDATENDPRDASGGNLLNKYEAFVLQVRRARPTALLVFVASVPLPPSATGNNNPNFQFVGDIVRFMSVVHGVSYINYYDVALCASALVDGRVSPSPASSGYWVTASGPHPNPKTHQLIADVITSTLHSRLGRLPSQPTMANASTLDNLELCTTPSTYYSALDAFEAQGGSTEGVTLAAATYLMEDRAGKPGWIMNETSSRVIFSVRFGATPRLTITFLKSYERMGSVTMELNGRSLTLNGLYDAFDNAPRARVSQLHEQTLQVQREDDFWVTHGDEMGFSGVIGFDVKPQSTHNVTFAGVAAGDSHKFKIVTVSAC